MQPAPEKSKCAVRENPSCDTVQDKFLTMRAEIEDKVDGMNMDLSKTQSMCEETDGSYESQIIDLGNRLKNAEAQLAEATRIDIESQEQSRLKSQSVKDLEGEGERMTHECDASLSSIAMEMCGIKQIRAELYKMETKRPFIQDCEVSDWTPEDCTATCGGGAQILRRTVVASPNEGAGCPPLEMQRACGMSPCPTDCRLDIWSGWSSCSAKCGGGVKERVRGVHTEARHGGAPCEQTSESVACGTESCDVDCGLAAWTTWTTCSKACAGGFKIRERHITAPAEGGGSCPNADSSSRLEYQHCNPQECKVGLKCSSVLDVVLVLDGSGSVGGTSGWESTKKAAALLINSFNTGSLGAQIAVLVYGGPATWAGYQKCSDSKGTVDMSADCKVTWLSHFSTDTATLATSVGGVAWPKGSTFTAAALATAETELATSRADAQSVVIVITDGRPMNIRKTTEAAKRLRKKARLLWVPVTKKAPLSLVKTWASKPVADNVLALKDYKELEKPETIDRIIADACPVVA